MALPEFLDHASTTPFVWGGFDCCLFMADWVLDQRGIDPAPHLRGAYDTEEGCDALLARSGGLLAVVEDCAARAGLVRAIEPLSGSVGLIVVRIPGERHAMCGAICTGRRWAVLSPGGISAWPAEPVAMWSV